MADKGAEVACLEGGERVETGGSTQMIDEEFEEAREVAVIIHERRLAHATLAHQMRIPVPDFRSRVGGCGDRPRGFVRRGSAAQRAGGRSSHWRTQRSTTLARNSSRSTA
jgi:hypothetical protein